MQLVKKKGESLSKLYKSLHQRCSNKNVYYCYSSIQYRQVLSKDTTMPSAAPEESDDVKEAIRTCLRKAALVNYTRLSNYAKVPGMYYSSF